MIRVQDRRLIPEVLSDDHGAVAVIAAILVVAFVSLSAIVVDAGYMYDTRRQLQASAEAAALAGCQELIVSGDTGAARASATEYATLNAAKGPVKGLEIRRIDVDTSDNSVRVVVAQQAPMFFSRMFGPATRQVQAAAKARAWKLQGGRYLVPWAIPIVKVVDRVEVWTGAGASTLLAEDGGDPLHYSGYISAPAGGGTDVFVRVYNEHDVPELLVESSGSKTDDAPAARIVVADAGAPFTAIALSNDYFPSDEPIYCVVRATTSEPQTEVGISVGGSSGKMTASDASGLNWEYGVGISAQDDPFTVIPVTLSVGGPGGGTALVYVHVRRSTLPVQQVSVTPIVSAPGGSVRVDVWLNDFDPITAVPGQHYTLRVSPQGNLGGNFGELNFGKITHAAGCPANPPGVVKPGVNYYDNVVSGYPGGVHVGDIIEMSPGGSGSNTDRALDERAASLASGEELIVAVPIVEKYSDKNNGAYDVIVVGFAAFRIVQYDQKGDVVGEFMEYLANPSVFDPNAGGNGGIYAPRLVNP